MALLELTKDLTQYVSILEKKYSKTETPNGNIINTNIEWDIQNKYQNEINIPSSPKSLLGSYTEQENKKFNVVYKSNTGNIYRETYGEKMEKLINAETTFALAEENLYPVFSYGVQNLYDSSQNFITNNLPPNTQRLLGGISENLAAGLLGVPESLTEGAIGNRFSYNSKGLHKGKRLLPIGLTNAISDVLFNGLSLEEAALNNINMELPVVGNLGLDELAEFVGIESPSLDKKKDFHNTPVHKNSIDYYSVLSYGMIKLLQKKRQLSGTQLESYTDFRQEIKDKEAFFVHQSKVGNYKDNNPNKKFGMPEYGMPGLDRRDFTKMHDERVVGKNTYDVFTKSPIEDDSNIEMNPNINTYRDYIKFAIHDVYNKETFRFRATLTDMSDSITANWEEVEYVGKADPIFAYHGGKRKFNFAFTISALSRQEFLPMWRKINKLYALMYPTYAQDDFVYQSTERQYVGNEPSSSENKNANSDESKDKTKQNTLPSAYIDTNISYRVRKDRGVAPFILLTLGDYFYKEPGYLSELSVTIDNEFPWEINIENDFENIAQLPHLIRISTGFQPIGKKLYQNSKQGRETNFFGWDKIVENTRKEKIDETIKQTGEGTHF